MAGTYRVTFHGTTRTVLGIRHGRDASVEITVPDTAAPLEHIADEIARELDLVRYEVQIGDEGGHIRLLGDTGSGIRFDIERLEEHDAAPCCPDPECPCRSGRACTFPGYADNH